MDVVPVPTDEELAAITAAYAVLMKPVAVAAADPTPPSNPWRFSGRWWTRPIASRRVRPG